ncbi:MAG: four helix bundle protein [Bacteroidales bacterium]|nr:four helix bundle protein [Bacteroidales bacterium]
MKTYKNLEIYQSAFNLAVNIYRMNIMLPNQELVKHGNKLRRMTIQIKDLIADGYSISKNEDELTKYLLQVKIVCDETVLLLNKIKKSHSKSQSVNYFILEYIKLKNAINKTVSGLEKNSAILRIPYTENKVLEPKI